MERLPQNRLILILVALFTFALVVAACVPDPTAQLISPNMVFGQDEEVVAAAEPTPVPDISTLSDEEIYAGLPDDVAAALPGDPEHGQQLTVENGCVGCHSLDPEQTAVAPSWNNVANHALVRVPDEGPALYLYTSIVDPNAYVVDGYQSNIMPQDFGEKLSAQDLADIISYLLTLRGGQ